MSKNNKEVKEHELKIWPEYFDDVESGRKTFEVRKLDRLFGKGDTLFLREWSPIKGYSGRETRKVITYVMAGGQWGLAEGNCILGIQPLPEGTGEVGLRWVKASDDLPAFESDTKVSARLNLLVYNKPNSGRYLEGKEKQYFATNNFQIIYKDDFENVQWLQYTLPPNSK